MSGAPAIGPAMISRLQNGTANWRVEHLVAYTRARGLPEVQFLAPAYKLGKLFGRGSVTGLLRVHHTEDDEQNVADLVDAIHGDDPLSSAD